MAPVESSFRSHLKRLEDEVGSELLVKLDHEVGAPTSPGECHVVKLALRRAVSTREDVLQACSDALSAHRHARMLDVSASARPRRKVRTGRPVSEADAECARRLAKRMIRYTPANRRPEVLRVMDDVRQWMRGFGGRYPRGYEIQVGAQHEPVQVAFFAAGTAAHPPIRKEWTVSREIVDEEAVRVHGEAVAAAFAREQHRAAGTRRGPTSWRPDVVTFVNERTASGERPHFPSLMQAWNREYPDRPYADSRNMVRDFRKLTSRREMRPR